MNQQLDTGMIVISFKHDEAVCLGGVIIVKIDGKLIPVQATADFPIPFKPFFTNG